MKKLSISASLAAILLLGGCAFSNDALFPSLMGSETQEDIVKDSNTGSDLELPVGNTNFKPVAVSKGSDTGTFVGQKVTTFRNELTQLQKAIQNHNSDLQKIRSSVVNNALQYHKTAGNIEAKLQVGTTPGNPQMFGMLQSAQNNVQIMGANAIALNQLSTKVSSDAAMTNYLLDSIRSAFSVSGAVDEDHRQLRILESETSQTAIVINGLMSEINSDAARQQQYVETANANLLNLDGAIRQGNYGVSNAYVSPMSSGSYNTGYAAKPLSNLAPVTVSGKPLFTAKFNKSDVQYKDGLKSAVNSATSKKSNVVFDVVAVSPMGGSASAGSVAKDKAAKIFQDIIDMGVSADRVNISTRTNANADVPEVQVFVR